jgi:YihY family inner membrane protein
VVRRIDAFQQQHRPLALGFAVVKKFGDDRAGSLAALIAYYGFLALFPLLLLMTTVLGFVLGRNQSLYRDVLKSALADFPIIGSQLGSAIRPLRGSGAGLAVGLVGLLWGSLGVTQAGQLAMAEVWNVPGVVRPNFVSRLFRGLALFAVLGLGVIATTVLASVSTFGEAAGLAKVLGVLGSATLNVGLYLTAFRVMTPASVPTRQLVPGAVAGGLAWSLLQALGGYLVGHQLRHASQVYGFFASVLGLVSWLYLGAQVSLYAAELNVVKARSLWPRSIVQPPLTEADKRAFDDIALQGERRPEQSVTSSWSEGGEGGGAPDAADHSPADQSPADGKPRPAPSR